MNFPSQILGWDPMAIFYNLSTNQRLSIGGTISCRPIGIENFQNINKRWRYCTEKEEKWAKETKYSTVQLLTNNAFWREKNGGKRKGNVPWLPTREQFQFFEQWLVYIRLRASERVRFQLNIDQVSAIFLSLIFDLSLFFCRFLEYFSVFCSKCFFRDVHGIRHMVLFFCELIFSDLENFFSLRYLILSSRYFSWCCRFLIFLEFVYVSSFFAWWQWQNVGWASSLFLDLFIPDNSWIWQFSSRVMSVAEAIPAVRADIFHFGSVLLAINASFYERVAR